MKYLKKLWQFLTRPRVLFMILLVVCGLLYNYHKIMFYRPIGIHQWRSSVSAAIALNYYHGGDFFKSQTNALLADDKSSDISIVEFPILYYFVSILYRIFGFNEFWFRITQVILGFIGLFYLFKASYYYTRDWFYAAFLPLIVFTSPIYIFYLNNFIPDAVALSVVFIAFFFLVRFLEKRNFRLWFYSMLLFLLAGLMKTSSLLLFFGVGGVAVMELIFSLFSKKEESHFRFGWKYIATYLGVLLVVVAWYAYARIYSDLHPRSVSEVEIRPIWILSAEMKQNVISEMKVWFNDGHYHSTILLIASLVMFVIIQFFRKSTDKLLLRLGILLLPGAIVFTLLFFRSMRWHDYYQINNLVLLVIVVLSFITFLREKVPNLYRSIWLKTALVIVAVLLINHARMHIRDRYDKNNYHYKFSANNLAMFDITSYLRSLGIERTDTVFCTPDGSVNRSLYLMDQKGITDFDSIGRFPIEQRIEIMKHYNVEYVILGSRENYMDVENLDEILGEKIGQTGNTEIFRLIY